MPVLLVFRTNRFTRDDISASSRPGNRRLESSSGYLFVHSFA